MKTYIRFSLVALISIAISSASEAAYITASSGANMRSTPNGRKIGALAAGAVVTLLKRVGGWYSIRSSNGRRAFIHASLIGGGTEAMPPGECRTCKIRNNQTNDVRKLARFVEQESPPIKTKGNPKLPIIIPFERGLASCAPGCGYTHIGIWGDRRHKAKKSCHNSARAIDVTKFRCPSGAIGVNNPRFKQIVNCLKARSDLHTLFQIPDHYNHVHVAIQSCELSPHIGKVRGK